MEVKELREEIEALRKEMSAGKLKYELERERAKNAIRGAFASQG